MKYWLDYSKTNMVVTDTAISERALQFNITFPSPVETRSDRSWIVLRRNLQSTVFCEFILTETHTVLCLFFSSLCCAVRLGFIHDYGLLSLCHVHTYTDRASVARYQAALTSRSTPFFMHRQTVTKQTVPVSYSAADKKGLYASSQ